ncbi:hypothetical protein V6N13_134731 [Hibiscus sabdariffa]|uniref:Uncharacterized protein n=1 Tax=Hibiscus sabdariffa TaxID=183260 RepID=A0ABR2R4M0_9ROSI
MDLEEVKACREHERMLEMPSSGGNSPIASWRISSPDMWVAKVLAEEEREELKLERCLTPLTIEGRNEEE